MFKGKNPLHDAYIWNEKPGWIGVRPPPLASSIWRAWLARQDASLRRFVSDPAPGYWLIKEEAHRAVVDRFGVLGWGYEKRRPPFLDGSTKEPGGSAAAPVSDSYAVLFLLEGAPKEVVDAAYKALQLKSHSDRGGDEDRSKEINIAKDEIYKARGW